MPRSMCYLLEGGTDGNVPLKVKWLPSICIKRSAVSCDAGMRRMADGALTDIFYVLCIPGIMLMIALTVYDCLCVSQQYALWSDSDSRESQFHTVLPGILPGCPNRLDKGL